MNTKNDKEISDFIEALAAAPIGGQPAVVIGGQAVNFWCEYASKTDTELSHHKPFTSQDLDMVADSPKQVIKVAQVAGLKIIQAKDHYSGINQAALIDNQKQTLVQFLSGSYGLKMDEFHRSILHVELERPETGKTYSIRVLALLPLLKGKLLLATSPDDNRFPEDKKRDIKHIKLLIMCERGLLRRQLHQLYTSDTTTERDIIKELKDYLQLSERAKNAISALKIKDQAIDMHSAIPSELFKIPANFSKINNYLQSPHFQTWWKTNPRLRAANAIKIRL